MISQMFIWNLISYRNSFSMATGQNFFGFLFLLLAELILVVSLYYPNQDVTYVSSPTASKDMNDVILRDIFLIFSIISTMLSSLTIALVWIDFAQKARKLARNETQTTIPKTRTFLIVFEILLTAGMILACIFQDPNFAILFGMLTAICAIVLYTVGMTRLIKELSYLANRSKDSDSTLEKTQSYRRVILEIVITCSAAYLCLFGVVGNCLVVLVYFSTNWRSYSFPGFIPSPIISLQLILTFLVLFEWVVLVSLTMQIQRIIKTKKKIHGESDSVVSKGLDANKNPVKSLNSPPVGSMRDVDCEKETLSNTDNAKRAELLAVYQGDS